MRSRQSHVRSVFFAALVVVAMLLAGCAQQTTTAKSELVFSPPLLGAGDFPKLRAPAQQIADEIGKGSGIKIGAYVPTDYGNTLLGLKRGDIDIAYLPVGLYPRAVAEAGVKPAFLVVVGGKTTEDSAMYVKSDSGLNSMADLAGKTVSTADPFSAAGWVVPAAELKKLGIDPVADITMDIRAVDVDSLVLVLKGEADAAIANPASLQDAKVGEAGGAAQLKALQEFKDVPIGVIVFNKTVTSSQATKLSKAMAGIEKSGATAKDADGNSVPLLKLFGWDGLKAAKTADFKSITETAQALGMVPAK